MSVLLTEGKKKAWRPSFIVRGEYHLVRGFSPVFWEPFARNDLALGGGAALQLVHHELPRHVLQPFERLLEDLLRLLMVPTPHHNIKDVVVLTPRSPSVMAFLVDCLRAWSIYSNF